VTGWGLGITEIGRTEISSPHKSQQKHESGNAPQTISNVRRNVMMEITARNHFRPQLARPENSGRVRPTNMAYIAAPTERVAALRPPEMPVRVPGLRRQCANCRWKHACGGSSGLRAERVSAGQGMQVPVCYYRPEEIIKKVNQPDEAMECDVLLREQAA
jgi:hypothetical protein